MGQYIVLNIDIIDLISSLDIIISVQPHYSFPFAGHFDLALGNYHVTAAPQSVCLQYQ